MSEFIGEAFVAIRPDASTFRVEAEQQIDRALKQVSPRESLLGLAQQSREIRAAGSAREIEALSVAFDRLERAGVDSQENIAAEAARVRQELAAQAGAVDQVGAAGTRSFGALAFRATAAGTAIALAVHQARAFSDGLVDIQREADAAGAELGGIAAVLAEENEHLRQGFRNILDDTFKLIGYDRERVRLAKELARESQAAAAAVEQALQANRAAFGEPGLRGPGAVDESNLGVPRPAARLRRPVGPTLRLEVESVVASITESLEDDLRAAQQRADRLGDQLAKSRLTGNKLGELQLQHAQALARVDAIEDTIASQREAAAAEAASERERARAAAEAELERARQARELRLQTNITRAELAGDIPQIRAAFKAAIDYFETIRDSTKGLEHEQARAALLALREQQKQALEAAREVIDPDEITRARLENDLAAAKLTAGKADDRKRAQALVDFYETQVADARKIRDAQKRALEVEQARSSLIAARQQLADLTERPAATERTSAFDLLQQAARTFAQSAGNVIGADQPFRDETAFTADLAQWLRRMDSPASTAAAGRFPTRFELNDDRIVRALERIEAKLPDGAAQGGGPPPVSGALDRNDRRFSEARNVRDSIEGGMG